MSERRRKEEKEGGGKRGKSVSEKENLILKSITLSVRTGLLDNTDGRTDRLVSLPPSLIYPTLVLLLSNS